MDVIELLTLKRAFAKSPEIPQKVQAVIIIAVPKTFLFDIQILFPIRFSISFYNTNSFGRESDFFYFVAYLFVFPSTMTGCGVLEYKALTA